MGILHTQALGPKARRAVEQAHSLGTTWTYLEDHLREQRERIDNLLSDTLRTGELASPEDLYLYYRKVCQFLDTEEGESKVDSLITVDQLDMLLCMLPSEETFKWRRWAPGRSAPHTLRLLLAASRKPEGAGPVAGRSRGRGQGRGLAFRLPEMVRALYTGGHMWELPHAGSVRDV